MISAEAVEAASRAMLAAGNHVGGWDNLPAFMRDQLTRDATLALEAAAPYMLEPFSRIADNLRATSDSHRKMAEYDPTLGAHIEIARELGIAALNIRRVIEGDA